MKRFCTSFTALLIAAVVARAADIGDGKTVYERSCKSCHGGDGTPNPAIAKMFKVDMRPLGSAAVQSLSDDQIKSIITNGQGKMHPVKSVTGSSLDDVVAYVRSLKK